MTLTFEWRRGAAAWFRLGPQWDALLESWGVDCPFLRWDWIRSWLRVYGRDGTPWLGIARNEAGLVGLAPLHAQRIPVAGGLLSLRTVRLAGDGPLCADHLVLPVAPGHEQAFAEALVRDLFRQRHAWDRFEFRDLRGDHPAWRAVEAAARSAGLDARTHLRTRCPYLPLPATWEAYLDETGRHRRHQIRRALRRFDADFEMKLERPASVRETDALMSVLEDLHTRGWRARGRPGVFGDARFRRFHRLHARRAYRRGTLWLLLLRAGERPAAVNFGFLSRRAVHSYQHGYEPALADYGPGMLVRLCAIRASIERGLGEWDFLRGSAAYKRDFPSLQERRGHDLIVHRNTLADRWARLAGRVRAELGDWVRARFDRAAIDRGKARLRIG